MELLPAHSGERLSTSTRTTLQLDEGTPPRSQFLVGTKLLLVFLGLFMAILLISLDQTIVSTALPRIVSQFNALGDVTWVVTAYFLTQGGFILFIGQILKLWNKKIIFLVTITLFEIGSLICALSKSMPVLILGRAVAGSGAAGIQVSVATIIPEITPLEKRPILFGSFGAIIGIAAVAGPLLGGAFTDNVSWQWCFWINLPLGGVAIALVSYFLDKDRIPSSESVDTGQDQKKPRRWMKIDWIAAVMCLGSFTSLLLSLQWGGNSKPWDSPTVIALFVVSGVLLVLILLWERFQGDDAMIPVHVLTRPTQLGCGISGFLSYVALFLATYYLPLWYQARGHSATRSGLDILPLLISVVVSAGISGAIVTKTGRYWWFLFLCPLSCGLGAGLLYTLKAQTPTAHLIGFQILYGVGVGGIFQNVLIAVQADYADNEKMIPQATAFVSFCQILGGIVGIAMAGSVFANRLRFNLEIFAPDLTPENKLAILQSVTVINTLPEIQRAEVIDVYTKSLDPVFLIGVPVGFLASITAFIIKDYNLHQRSAAATQGRI